jgi:hypothetical protein
MIRRRRHNPARIGARGVLSVILACTVLFAASSAVASDDRTERGGSCSGRSDWKLELRREEGRRLRVRYEIEGGRAGQEWHIYLSHNGAGFFAGARISTSGGHVEVRVRTRNRIGSDTITAGANNVATGETCGGRATL